MMDKYTNETAILHFSSSDFECDSCKGQTDRQTQDNEIDKNNTDAREVDTETRLPDRHRKDKHTQTQTQSRESGHGNKTDTERESRMDRHRCKPFR